MSKVLRKPDQTGQANVTEGTARGTSQHKQQTHEHGNMQGRPPCDICCIECLHMCTRNWHL
eukprot:5824574-Amphidinium_carterae.3